MPALNTTDVTLPTQIVDGIVEKTKTSGTIAALSGQEPMRFGDVTIVTFDDELTAEFVEQSAAKSEDDAKPDSVIATPHKAVVNFRTSDEFLIAGQYVRLSIAPTDDAANGQILSAEEGTFVNGQWQASRRWNGDQTSYGFNFNEQPSLLRVKVATYD